MKRVTEALGPHAYASLSADGNVLTYTRTRAGNQDIWVKNLETRREIALATAEGNEFRPELARDGSRVVYVLGQYGLDTMKGYVVSAKGGPADQFCEQCGCTWGFSLDNRLVLYGRYADRSAIHAFDLVARRDRVILRGSHSSLFQAYFSPDDQWLVFEAVDGNRSRLFISPIRHDSAAPEAAWIPIGETDGWADKPRWSPDGNLVYFVSHRNGFRCIWAQRLSPRTKQPLGAPFPVVHFHATRLGMQNVGLATLEISVGRDRLAFNLGELTGNIWMATLP
jgi:Tol biopolymer transport system component